MAEETVRGRCPRCGKAIEWAAAGGGPLAKGNLYRPFCSERCKLIDLGKWIDEEYRIASENPLPNEKEPEVALWPEGRAGGGPLARGGRRSRRWPFGQ